MTIMRKKLAAKIHRATVTEANIDYEGSITLPPQLREKAGLMPYDAVNIWDITNGARLETYVLPGEEDDGAICINGAAARLIRPGDLVIIARFAWLSEAECENFQAKIVMVDENNKVTAVKNCESNPKPNSFAKPAAHQSSAKATCSP